MFNITLDENIEVGNVNISQQGSEVLFSIDTKFYLKDDINYITGYCHRLSDFSFNSILIGGLGLGIVPYYIENNIDGVTDIDVIENNTNVINATSQLNHLSKSQIINEDFFTFTPSKNYDLILIDLWWLGGDNFENEKETLISKYSSYINTGGKLYFPIVDVII